MLPTSISLLRVHQKQEHARREQAKQIAVDVGTHQYPSTGLVLNSLVETAVEAGISPWYVITEYNLLNPGRGVFYSDWLTSGVTS